MVKTKDHGLQPFQSIRMKWEISTQSCILNLLGDGALPSPVVLFCCLDRKCFECYAVLAILAEYGSMGNLKKEDYMALGSYMGLEPVSESDEDDQSFVGTEIEETETGDIASKSLRNSHVCDYLGKLAQTWKIALPQMEQKSSPSLRLLRTLMRYVCAPGYVVKSKHGDKCASCRCNYEPLYQEFGVFLYPENRGELGSPPLFYGKLSDGTAVARTFQLYLYTPDKPTKNGKNGKNSNESCFVGDVALLEMVDPDLVTKEDYHVLRLNGFAHEINANGTIYWARAIVFHGFSFMSKCVFKAAVETRIVAHDPRKCDSSIVCCTETVKEWLKNMGYSRRGFSVVA